MKGHGGAEMGGEDSSSYEHAPMDHMVSVDGQVHDPLPHPPPTPPPILRSSGLLAG
jgi:hypothetical protein